MFDFRRTTVFCSGYRLLSQKMTRYAKNMGAAKTPWTPLATPVAWKPLNVGKGWFTALVFTQATELCRKFNFTSIKRISKLFCEWWNSALSHQKTQATHIGDSPTFSQLSFVWCSIYSGFKIKLPWTTYVRNW